jgi:hypothetical protein
MIRRRSAPATGIPITWATAVERFARAVHRYHDRVEVVGDRVLREQLREPGAVLGQALVTVRAARGNGGDGAQAVRDVLRAGTLCSHAIEAAVTATTARRAGDDAEAARALATVRTLAGVVGDLAAAGAEPRRPSRRRFTS